MSELQPERLPFRTQQERPDVDLRWILVELEADQTPIQLRDVWVGLMRVPGVRCLRAAKQPEQLILFRLADDEPPTRRKRKRT